MSLAAQVNGQWLMTSDLEQKKAGLAAGLKCCSAFAPVRNRTESPTGLRGAHLDPRRSSRTVRSLKHRNCASLLEEFPPLHSSLRLLEGSDSQSSAGSPGRRTDHRI